MHDVLHEIAEAIWLSGENASPTPNKNALDRIILLMRDIGYEVAIVPVEEDDEDPFDPDLYAPNDGI